MGRFACMVRKLKMSGRDVEENAQVLVVRAQPWERAALSHWKACRVGFGVSVQVAKTRGRRIWRCEDMRIRGYHDLMFCNELYI